MLAQITDANTYLQAEQYILEIPKFAGKHTVGDTKILLEKLGCGGIESKVIHIAGTNGKGSVCAYLRSILMASGCSVGMFTSPHLECMRERICVGNEMISEEEFKNVFEQVKKVLNELIQSEDDMLKWHPSFFEFLFLMAMVYFKEKQPEYIILETGLGGRLDATNSILKPAVCVITEIGYDHMQYLGDTISQIATEKAGIIKSNVPVVFVDKCKKVTDILKNYAAEMKAEAIAVEKNSILQVNIDNKTIDFSFHSGYYKYDGLSLNTTALYQTENASLAIAAAEVLQKRDLRITADSIKNGLKEAHWPGRMEEIFPGVYLDGAHNEDGIEAFLSTVKGSDCKGKRYLLFGVVADKRYEKMIEQIAKAQLFEEVAVTTLASDRSTSIDRLREIWEQYNVKCSFHQDAEEAYHYLMADRKNEDIVYIAGSLYLVGQIKSLIRRMTND